ncbi:hypothetical protein QNO21_01130 [Microbacterium sp. zg-Y818]|uniref:hypothetical protein n=1 Tax=unclassified Microbacterium TaxID=2609290 RepID=UPI00214A9534|nr:MULTISPECIES: hypothetical protein [unclassified Microbacterium]MCR2802122.1 hypothetical protein [Microbacterium sp. zg.Y818]WIM23978.1 hypothetical protein QNO21_01130 [Microbacterium sp. zg-Y818]
MISSREADEAGPGSPLRAMLSGVVIGDPTEAALVVLAAELGADAEITRARHPRAAEVPLDSA